jgi:lysyl-tRNA synthetase class 2
MSLKGLQLRTRVIAQIRQYLSTHGYAEIEPQLLSSYDPREPTIYPYQVGDRFLPTSPESLLKQTLAAGLGNCFAISHVFRNLEGEGRLHAPEFIMAEWYAQNTSYLDQMRFTQDLISTVIPDLPPTWPTLSWKQLWQQQLHTNLNDLIADQSMKKFAKKLELSTKNATWEQLFNQIADIYIVKHFPQHPFFLIDYPSKISPLAKPKTQEPDYAERFELFVNGIELANGNTENFNISSIKPFGIHPSFLAVLSKLSHQSWSGVGLGIDRLTMLVGGLDSIGEVNSL